MFKSGGTFNFCTKMYVKVRIHTKMYDMARINVQQSTTMYANLRNYTNIYEMMLKDIRQCTTKTHDYDKKIVARKSFTCFYDFLNRGFSYEKLRITANNRDKPRKCKKSCKSIKWVSPIKQCLVYLAFCTF